MIAIKRCVTAVVAALLIVCLTAPGLAAEQYALLVGVRSYDKPELKQLRYTEADVWAFYNVLSDMGYEDKNVFLMTQTAGALYPDRVPRRAQILQKLRQLIAACKPEDSLIVALAGHGVQFRDSKDTYFCPMDADLKKRDTLLSIDTIYKQLEDCKARIKLMFVDACRDTQVLGARAVRTVDLQETMAAHSKFPPRGSAAFFSCSATQKAYESPELGHGVFFHFVIEGMRGKADFDGDKKIDLPELELFVKRGAANYAQKQFNTRQIPELLNFTSGLPTIADWEDKKTGWLSLNYQEAGLKISQEIPDATTRTPVVAGVMPGSEADKAGLKRGDVLLKMDGRKLRDIDHVVRIEDEYKAGETVKFEISRDGKTMTLPVVLEAAPRFSDWTQKVRALAQQGAGWAQFRMGENHLYGYGVPQDFKLATQWYQKAADQNYREGHFGLGMMYRDGLGVKKDVVKGMSYLRKAAALDHRSAMVELGHLYLNGNGVDKDATEAVRWYRMAAEQGLAEGQFNLALCYSNGDGVAQDDKLAVQWHQKAAALDHLDARMQLAWHYTNGAGVEQDYAAARRVVESLVEDDNAYGINLLGDIYYYGNGAEKNNAKALKYYQLAADRGEAAAQHNLAYMYANGEGVAADDAIAVKYARLAAESGQIDAMGLLAGLYLEGRGGLPKDAEEATRWYTRAAEAGEHYAQFNLGLNYENGLGVEKDRQKAIYWLKKSAAQQNAGAKRVLGQIHRVMGGESNFKLAKEWLTQAIDAGDIEAPFYLALMHERGEGVPTNKQEAFRLYKVAAEKGIAAAQFNLGVYHRNGIATAVDYDTALAWFKKSAAQDFPEGINALGDVHYFGHGVEKDYKIAIRYFKQAAAKDFGEAMFNLGFVHEKGQGVTADPVEAVRWYQKSAEAGFSNGANSLGNAYYVGYGVKKDASLAAKYYRQAADSGLAASQRSLAQLYLRGEGVTKDRNEAIRLLQKAAAQGDEKSRKQLDGLQP